MNQLQHFPKMSITKVFYLSCNVILSQFNNFFFNLGDTELAVMEKTLASQVEIEEELKATATATPSQDAHNQGNLLIFYYHLFLI